VQVRRAQPQDAPAVEALYRLLVSGDDNIAVDPERLAALQSDASNYLLVAEVDGVVSGTAFLTICLDAMYGFQPYGVVENIIVHPATRARGVGAAVLNELEQIARTARCTKLMLLSSRARTEAHAFFQRLGFDGERKRGFVKYLNRVPAPRPRQ
jgi:N-acetylglutamate synthase-like GNAT family acetyltransferase